MKLKVFQIIVFILFNSFSGQLYAQRPLVFAYVGGYRGNAINAKAIEAQKLTHLLYAFADVRQNRAYLNYPKTDDANLRALVKLKLNNPDLKVLLSVGGQGWSRNFSDMALIEQSRQSFAQSCVVLVNQYGLDGVDIDWEFPGYAGEGGNKYQPEDKQNYTLLLKAMRQAFNRVEQQTGRHLLLTTAVDGLGSHYLPHTQMDQVQLYADYILLMAYNFNTPTQVGGHFLYSPNGWVAEGSADGAVKAFMAAGVPAGKLVLGMGFFPAAFRMASANAEKRDYQSHLTFRGGLAKVNNLIGKNGFTRYWDAEGQSPYLFNPVTRMHISYEDEESAQAKARYVMNEHIAGVMYWDYFSDPGRKLLNVIDGAFRANK
jgi:chitinase